MNRLEAFEKMLAELQRQRDDEKKKMDALKMQGKEKSATYRQYMGNRLMYQKIFALYEAYGLLEEDEGPL